MNDITLYHGSRGGIVGKIEPNSRIRCDFGKGFYIGTKPEQAKTLIFNDNMPIFYTVNFELKDALTNQTQNKTCTDHLGNTFANQAEMCNYWNIDRFTYYSCRQDNLSIIEAIEFIPRINQKISHWTFNTKFQIIQHIENQYFLCIFDNHETIMHYDKIIEYCTKQLQSQYQQGGQKWLKQHLTETEKATD